MPKNDLCLHSSDKPFYQLWELGAKEEELGDVIIEPQSLQSKEVRMDGLDVCFPFLPTVSVGFF